MKSRKSFTPKTFSQNVARFFEYGCYLLFIPGILALAVSCIFFYFLIVSVPSMIFGIVLFIGYLKHSRDDLSEEKVLLLWIGTFIFNLIPLLLAVYENAIGPDIFRPLELSSVILILLVSWWFVSVCLSGGALFSELWKR